jgi:hypothetical protein
MYIHIIDPYSRTLMLEDDNYRLDTIIFEGSEMLEIVEAFRRAYEYERQYQYDESVQNDILATAINYIIFNR